LELRQLQYFQSVGQLLSITKTADKFHIAQPSITTAIQNLERELGVQLIDRSHRQIMLTAEGHIFLQKIDDVLCRLSDSVREMNDYRVLSKGHIRLGITPTTSGLIFPRIFTEFRTQYPQIDLTSDEEGSLTVIKLLEQGEIEIGIIIISELSSNLEVLPVTTEQVMLCLPKNHALAHCQNVPFSSLKNDPFLLFKEDTYLRQIILQECDKSRIKPKIAFSSSQIETIVALVNEGAGITFLLESIIRKRLDIVCLPLATPLFVKMGLAWNKGTYLSKAARTFIDFATKRQSQNPL
jgi:DNA-binding transcriptional LysR family regulator